MNFSGSESLTPQISGCLGTCNNHDRLAAIHVTCEYHVSVCALILKLAALLSDFS